MTIPEQLIFIQLFKKQLLGQKPRFYKPIKDKTCLFYIRTQYVLHTKHSLFHLYKIIP
jgi:hypothetical protein